MQKQQAVRTRTSAHLPRSFSRTVIKGLEANRKLPKTAWNRALQFGSCGIADKTIFISAFIDQLTLVHKKSSNVDE